MKISKTGIKLTLAVTALFIISTVVLAVALVFNLKSGQGADDNGSKELPPPNPGTGLLEDFEFRLPKSVLGIYAKAAVATDTRPCAHVGT